MVGTYIYVLKSSPDAKYNGREPPGYMLGICHGQIFVLDDDVSPMIQNYGQILSNGKN